MPRKKENIHPDDRRVTVTLKHDQVYALEARIAEDPELYPHIPAYLRAVGLLSLDSELVTLDNKARKLIEMAATEAGLTVADYMRNAALAKAKRALQ